jgi:hypothetical protein
VPQPQVEIEARIVQTNRSFANSLGLRWGISGAATSALGNTLPLAFPNTAVGAGNVNLPVAAAPSTASLALGSINGAFNLDVALSALEKTGQGRILSTPRVSTQNNIEAEITQGIQIPIQTIANNTVTVSFRDARSLEGDAADYRVGHRDHADQVANESPTSAARSTASRRSTRSAPRRRCWSATARPRDWRHLHQPRAEHAGADAGALSPAAARMAVQEEHGRGRSRELLIFLPEDRQAVGSSGTAMKLNYLELCRARGGRGQRLR